MFLNSLDEFKIDGCIKELRFESLLQGTPAPPSFPFF